MSGFLDQSEIDKLQYELAILDQKVEKSKTAKDKIRKMYFDTIKHNCPNNMETLDEIGIVINDINMKIGNASKYYESFNTLKNSYSKRV